MKKYYIREEGFGYQSFLIESQCQIIISQPFWELAGHRLAGYQYTREKNSQIY